MNPDRFSLPWRQSGNGAESGQVAIGTLVLFIALTLVTMMTASLLFDTAGLLSNRASSTGEETSKQLSERLDIVAKTGDNITNKEIKQVNIVVKSTSGSTVDLRNITVRWNGPRVGTTLVHESNANAGQDTFSIVEYTDVDGGSEPVITDAEDRYGLRFEPGVVFGSAGLKEGERVDLTLVTPAGGTQPISLSVPQSLSGEDSVEL